MGKEKSDLWMAISKASTTGFTILCSIGICMGLGYAIDHYVGTHPWGVLLDHYVGTSPWGLLIGGIVGGFLGLYGVIRQCM